VAYTLTIGGVATICHAGALRLRLTANNQDTMACAVTSLDGSHRPALDAVITLDAGSGARIFDGFVNDPLEHGLGNVGLTAITTEVSAIDRSSVMTRVFLNGIIPAGTLKAAMTVLVPFMAGIALHPAQVDGPDLVAMGAGPLTIAAWVTQLETLTGYLTDISGGYFRMYAPGDVVAPFDILAGPTCHAIGDVTVEPVREAYANQILVWQKDVANPAFYLPQRIYDDATEIAAHGVWQKVVEVPAETLSAGVDALGAAYLAQSLPITKRVTYTTQTDGLRPGQLQTITLPFRNLDHTFLITDIDVSDVGPDLLQYAVTAIEGSVYRPGWRQVLQAAFAGGGSASLAAGVIGTGATARPPVYWLGGSASESVQSSTPDWVPASARGAVRATIDSVARGTLAGLVTARVRADAGSVTVRLRNVSDAITAGTSAAITNTDFQTITFVVALTAGTKEYAIELLPSVANSDVQLGSAYLE
jgi:hypothetical protein